MEAGEVPYYRMCSLSIGCVLLLKNVFSSMTFEGMCQWRLARLTAAWGRAGAPIAMTGRCTFCVQCCGRFSLSIECVLLL